MKRNPDHKMPAYDRPVSPGKPPDAARVQDFLDRLRTIFGEKVLPLSGAELIAKDRDRY
jgi:hypothetical protein